LTDEFKKHTLKVLEKMAKGSLRIRKAYRVTNELLFFLVQKQQIL